jgi:F-type H+-transporting ATPase subunit alpha
MELLKQKQYAPMAVNEMVPLIYAGIHGLLDNIPVNRIMDWEADFLAHCRHNKPEMLSRIEDEGKLSNDLEAQIMEVIVAFNKAFS